MKIENKMWDIINNEFESNEDYDFLSIDFDIEAGEVDNFGIVDCM